MELYAVSDTCMTLEDLIVVTAMCLALLLAVHYSPHCPVQCTCSHQMLRVCVAKIQQSRQCSISLFQ